MLSIKLLEMNSGNGVLKAILSCARMRRQSHWWHDVQKPKCQKQNEEIVEQHNEGQKVRWIMPAAQKKKSSLWQLAEHFFMEGTKILWKG
jgi:hypothetical protein